MRKDVIAYPGLLCPGLIEAFTWSETTILGAAYPGLLCPGLIEATGAGGEILQPSETYPGLLCPGLIEAGPVVDYPP